MDFAAGDLAERRGDLARAGEERTLRCAQRMSCAKFGTAKVEMARSFETRSKHCIFNPEGTSG